MFEFVRRQYTVARFYSPKWWTLALVFCTISQLAFWGCLVLAIVGIERRANWSWAPVLVSLAMYLTYVARAALRQNAASHFLPEQLPKLKTATLFDIWVSPIAALANWLGLLGSLLGCSITWRCITYAIKKGGQVCILDRSESSQLQPSAASVYSLRKAG
jgi:hypothetical protein